MPDKLKNICVLGDGGWGTTLAIHLAEKQYRVKLWGAFPDYVRETARTRYNRKFLPGIKIPTNVHLIDNLAEAVHGTGLIVLATPSQYTEGLLKKLTHIDLSGKVIVSAIKGVDTKGLRRMSEIIKEYLGNVPFAVLSGPTIASEVARKIPSTAVIACKNRPLAEKLQNIFNSESFRIYTNTDIIGVELGGSIKNIIAIACGVCDGLGFGTNTKAAILSRGLSEMVRLGQAMGAEAKTFYGLTGLGDLATTCFSPQSRNRSVGEALGKGKSIRQITSSMSMVAEGVETVKAVYKISRKYRIPMPITEATYNIIYKDKASRQAVKDLMKRKVKAE